jgi:hypothetical protein
MSNLKKKNCLYSWIKRNGWLGITDYDVFQTLENGLFQSEEEIYRMNN